MSTNSTNDTLREHIQQLLFNYAKIHLTTDYIAYTESLFNKIMPRVLQEVALIDPTSFTVTPDPFDTLYKIHHIDQLSKYEDKFKPNTVATQLLKQHLRTRDGRARTERVVHPDGEPVLPIAKPFEPALSRRSRRNGRTTQNSGFLQSLPRTCEEYLLQSHIKPLQVDPVQEPDIDTSYEKSLKVHWVIKKEEHGEVRGLLKHVTDMRRPQPNRPHSVLDPFLKEDVHLMVLPLLTPEFTPIFTRKRRLGTGQYNPTNNAIGFEQLEHVLTKVKIDSDDETNTNLEVVNGWHAINISSPSSLPTPTSSQEEDRIDQLFLDDSPPTEPLSMFMLENMDEVEMPRSRRIGGTYGIKPHILQGESLATFLPKVLGNSAPTPLVDLPTRQRSPDSVLDQASHIDEYSTYGGDWNDFNSDISQFFLNEDPRDIIMKAKLTEDKNLTFMQVPDLPPPNLHGPSLIGTPTTLQDLLSVPHNMELLRDKGMPFRRPLKRATGESALRLSLSWVTFTTDARLPSHEEIIGVSELLPMNMTLLEIDELVDRSLGGGDSGEELRSNRVHLADQGQETIDIIEAWDRRHGPYIALSRKDRRLREGSQHPPGHPFEYNPNRSISIENENTSDNMHFANLEEHEIYEPFVMNFEDLIDTKIFCDQDPISVLDPYLTNSDSPYGILNDDKTMTDSTYLLDTTSSTVVNSSYANRGGLPEEGAGNRAIVESISQTERLLSFAKLRAKSLVIQPPPVRSISDTDGEPTKPDSATKTPEIDPSAVLTDPTTLQLPDSHRKIYRHRYMASLDFVQRQSIVRALRGPHCQVDIAERTSLGGVDIIIDPFSAIIIASLFTLPARCKQLVDRIWDSSWRFGNILVILEAYPGSRALKPIKATSDVPSISAYTAPILKAIRKLRRDVIIGEAYENKSTETKVQYAFADDVGDTARFVRYFGDLAEERDVTNGILWGDREWLEWDMSLDEESLSLLKGMNRMSATILLCKASAEEILDMSPEERIDVFASLIGVRAVELLNADIAERFQHVGSDEMVDVQDSADSLTSY